MFLQVRFIPPPDIAGPLTAIGQAIGGILAPQRELKQQVALLLLTNPELGQQLAARQRQLEGERAEVIATAAPPRLEPEEIEALGVAEAPIPPAVRREARRIEPPPPNVIPFLPREFVQGLLGQFPETQEERIATALRRDDEFFQNQVRVAKETVLNQLVTLEVDTQQKRRIGQSVEKLDELIDTVATSTLERMSILSGITEGQLTDVMQTLLQLESSEIVELIRAKAGQTLNPLEMVELVGERMALQVKTSEELSRIATAIEEAPRELKPLEISNLRNTIALRDRQFRLAGIDLQSTIALDPRLSLFMKRLQGVEIREITFPDLELEGQNIDPVNAADLANAMLNRIRAGALKADFDTVRAAVVDTPSGIDLFAGMSGTDQRKFVQRVLEIAEEERTSAEAAIQRREEVKKTSQQLQAEITENEEALRRLRLRAEAALNIQRPGLSREAKLNLQAAAAINMTLLTDAVTGKTGKELQDEIEQKEELLRAFPKPPPFVPRQR